MAAECEHEKQCLESVASLHEPGVYAELLDHDKSVLTNHRIFRMLSREAGAVYQRLLVRHRIFPSRLFRLVTCPGFASELELACDPSLDDYARSYLSKFHGELDSPEARLELAIIVMNTVPNTARRESVNASIRRSVVATSTQTKMPKLKTISAEHVLRFMRRRENEYLHPRGHPHHWQRLEGKATKVKLDKNGRPRMPRRRGGGGSWRAYVSKRCKGVAKAVFKTLAREYKELSAEEKEHLGQEGAGATLSHKRGGRSFGLNARELSRAMAKRSAMQLGIRTEGDAALLPIMDSRRALAVPTAGVENQLATTRADCRVLKAIAHKEDEAVAQAICAWRSDGSFAQRDRLVLAVPSIAAEAPSLHGDVPIGQASMVCRFRVPFCEQVPRFLGMRKYTQFAKFMDSLLKEWESLHHVIRHEACEAVPAEPKPNYKRKPSCLQAQLCLCGGRGDSIWAAKLWFCTALKASLPTSTYRDLLSDGWIVLRFICHDGAPLEAYDDADLHPSEDCVLDLVVHLAFMTWSPYRPTFRRMSWPGRKVDGLGRLELMATHTYQAMLEVLGEIVDSGCASVAMLCYQLDDAQEPVAKLRPLWVLAHRVRGSGVRVHHLRKQPGDPAGRASISDRDPGWGEEAALLGMNRLPADIGDEGVESDRGESGSEEEGLAASAIDSDIALIEDLLDAEEELGPHERELHLLGD